MTWCELEGRHVVRRRRRRWAHAHMIHAASHVDHKNRVAWVPISLHTCDSVSIIMVLRRSSAKTEISDLKFCSDWIEKHETDV